MSTIVLNFQRYKQLSLQCWLAYFRALDKHREDGAIQAFDYKLYFPTIILFIRTDQHFITELIGASETYSGLVEKHESLGSTSAYLFQFADEWSDRPCIDLSQSAGCSIRGVRFQHAVDEDDLRRRFPCIEFDKDAPRIESDFDGALLGLNGSNYVSLFDCIIINRYRAAMRMKHVLAATIVLRSTSEQNLLQMMKSHLTLKNNDTPNAVHWCRNDREAEFRIAAQFTSFFMFGQGLRETTLGEFLKTHPDFVKRSLGVDAFEYEPTFEWIDQPEGANYGHAINPDLMVKSKSGTWDIYDLKRPLLDRRSLTKGRAARRRFIDYVEDGIAQLAHYHEYFAFERNREYARNKYGIVCDNPKLVLVVGNWDNIDRRRIDEASRRLNKIEIVDYDTLALAYLNSRRP